MVDAIIRLKKTIYKKSKLNITNNTSQPSLPRPHSPQRKILPINTLTRQPRPLLNRALDLLHPAISINNNDIVLLVRMLPHHLEKLPDPRLKLRLLVLLPAIPTSLTSSLGADVEENAQIRARQADVRMPSPLQPEAGDLLRGRVDAAGVVVAVDDDGDALRYPARDLGRQLPSVRAEEEVHHVVFHFALAGKVGVDHLADGRGAVGEADVLDAVAALAQAFDEEGALRGFAAAVQAFEDDQFATFGGGWSRGGEGEGLRREAVGSFLRAAVDGLRLVVLHAGGEAGDAVGVGAGGG